MVMTGLFDNVFAPEEFYIPEYYKSKFYTVELVPMFCAFAGMDNESSACFYHYLYGYIHALYTSSQISRGEYDSLCYRIERVSQMCMDR